MTSNPFLSSATMSNTPVPDGLCMKGLDCVVIVITVLVTVMVVLIMVLVSSSVTYFKCRKKKRIQLITDNKVWVFCTFVHAYKCKCMSNYVCMFCVYVHMFCVFVCVCLCVCVCVMCDVCLWCVRVRGLYMYVHHTCVYYQESFNQCFPSEKIEQLTCNGWLRQHFRQRTHVLIINFGLDLLSFWLINL